MILKKLETFLNIKEMRRKQYSLASEYLALANESEDKDEREIMNRISLLTHEAADIMSDVVKKEKIVLTPMKSDAMQIIIADMLARGKGRWYKANAFAAEIYSGYRSRTYAKYYKDMNMAADKFDEVTHLFEVLTEKYDKYEELKLDIR